MYTANIVGIAHRANGENLKKLKNAMRDLHEVDLKYTKFH